MNNVIEITSKYYHLTDEQAKKLSVVCDRLIEMNRVLNLTALKTAEEIAILHFFDSLTLLNTGLFKDKNVIDVGCGGGFPSFPLAVCSENCRITANDSTQKKLRFVEETAKQAGIDLSVMPGRAEEIARTEQRDSFGIAVARGVARLNILCELCLPLVKPGGHFIAMKGSRGKEELKEAKRAIKTLSAKTVDIIDISIPLFDRNHTIIIIEKTGQTPEEYPRTNSKICKSPL